MKDLDLLKIRDIALFLYKNNAPDPTKHSGTFLSECWVDAVVSELKRNGVDIEIERDHLHMIKDIDE